jgi:type II restriction/modification system DNA methylase subunit YeeA
VIPQEFVNKWRPVTEVSERSTYQQHFLDLCELVGHGKPIQLDPKGEFFTFEAGAAKQSGGNGWADVWYKGHFAIEYKKPGVELEKAYAQILQYRESLQNPPLLITCNIQSLVIHTNFTNSVKQIHVITLDDLLRDDGLLRLRNLFYNPEAFRPEKTAEEVTEEAAARFGRLAEQMRLTSSYTPHEIAHYLIRLLFCLFAEDINLLPKGLFTRMVATGVRKPDVFNRQVKELFECMAEGKEFGAEEILYFNGGLFDAGDALALTGDGIAILHEIAQLDWSAIEPSIFGTLFTRSLDPAKRSQLGAQYTSKEDILLIVEPVLMAPLRKEWAEVQSQARALAGRRAGAGSKAQQSKLQNELQALLMGFVQKVRALRVLDPACGSGNFLYVCLRLLLDLEKEISTFCGEIGIQPFFPEVSPLQLYGIEINDYAHELAQATVWIGYLQWLHENGYGFPSEPILKELGNIRLMDAILAFDAEGKPVEPEWPVVDVIVGNPPFLGDKRMRAELGDTYISILRSLYDGRIPGQSDLVCYWFENARNGVLTGRAKRVGLLSTNSIRNGANNHVLLRVKETCSIFWAVSDRDWILDGAAVNVSMIAFDSGEEKTRLLDGIEVTEIHSDLSTGANTVAALKLLENTGLCFLGMMKAGPFDIDSTTASQMIDAPLNLNGRPNSDVLKRRIGGQDVTGRIRDVWIIDFGINMSEEDASLYELPFDYVRKHVKPVRDENRRKHMKEKWWLFGEVRPGLRKAISKLNRCIITPEVSKYRVFTWMDVSFSPDHTLHVIARDDDYAFGVLHSRFHQLWSLKVGSTLEDRPRYSSSRIFETFPFLYPPGKEPTGDARVERIAEAARRLVVLRDDWLNPPGLPEKELTKRTLTNLYNQRPDWLAAAHAELDAAVAEAYGWPADLSDEEILERLLAENLRRVGSKGPATTVEEDEQESSEETR